MFIRITKANGRKYMQVRESYRRPEDGAPRQHTLWSLGRFDEKTYQRAKKHLPDWGPLNRCEVVLNEIAAASGPLQGKGYFLQYKGGRR